MPVALLSLGANLGDRRATVERACAQLQRTPDVQLGAVSSLHETRPIGGPAGQEPYANAAALVETSRDPLDLLAALQAIENSLGRTREVRWQARTMDLDLLLYGDRVIDSPTLAVPHPRMAFRKFVIDPAVEIAPTLRHPTIGWTIARLHEHLHRSRNYVAIAGGDRAERRRLAIALAQRVEGRHIPDPAASPGTAQINSSGSSSTSPIEFLDARAAVLARDCWTEDAGFAISDFWFDDGPWSRGWPAGAEQEPLRAAWLARRSRVVPTKLLIVLEATDAENPHRVALAEHARAVDAGPILRLKSGDDAAALDEAVAALEAMR